MAAPPPYSSQPAGQDDQPSQGDLRPSPHIVLNTPPESDAASSTVSSEATLPGYATPSTASSDIKRSLSLRYPDKRSSMGSSLASTEAARRLRAAEEEVRRLRELNQRLRNEGVNASSLTPTYIRQMREDAKASSADSPGRKANSNLFKNVCSTDLLFLIDTTSSMSGHIAAAKNQIKSIIDDINFAFLGEAEIRIAVVGYKDHQDNPNIQSIDFTTDVNSVKSFIDGLRATGGGDTPEDMLGGINKALNSTWKNQTRCIIHIADAPPHGQINHDLGTGSDNYAIPGSEPHKLHYQPLITQMVGLNINYALLRINYFTDRMALNFMKVYLAAGAECKLFHNNKYYSEASDLISGATLSYLSSNGSFHSAKAKLQFEETELGTSYEKLRHMVVRNVTSSASRTAVRTMSSGSGPRKPKFESKLMSSGMGAIKEDEDDVTPTDIKLETMAPQWQLPGWFNETLHLEGFSPDVGVHGASTLNDMMDDDENIKMSITELTIHKRNRPFAQGAMRVAAYAKTKDSNNRFVVKSFKKNGKKLAHLAEDMRCQALCKAFALEFSALVEEKYALDFIVTTCLRGKRRAGITAKEEHLSLEPLIEGKYQKYNNNTNWVNHEIAGNDIAIAAQAFSHFTFERSQGRYLISDLQGVKNLLTDPAIHTRDENRFRLSDTNLNKEGFKFFFSAHECNDLCRNLQLQTTKSMFKNRSFTYRTSWPSLGNVACCSNKLCGKIVKLASTKQHPDYQGHNWCETCFPQLNLTVVNMLCVGPGAQHEFRASRFFWESQGRMMPRLCPEHREGELRAVVEKTKDDIEVIGKPLRRSKMPGSFEEEDEKRESWAAGDDFPPSEATVHETSSSATETATAAEPSNAPLTPPLPNFSRKSVFGVPKTTPFTTITEQWPKDEENLAVPKRSINFPDEGGNPWAEETEADLDETVTKYSAPTTPYTPYSPATVAKTKKRENPAAASRLSLVSSGGGFWSKLKKRSLQLKPSSAMLRKKDS